MTGYGAAAAETESLRASATVKSVNHRFLDVTIHVSRRLAPLEADIKGLVQSRLRRGRVEVAVHASVEARAGDTVVASRPLVAALVKTLRELQTEYGLEGGVHVSDIARFPGALDVIEGVSGLDETKREQVLGVVARALDGLEEMRRAEGENLARALSGALDAIETAVGRIEALSEESKDGRREALCERARLLREELGLDESRLYQEVVRLVDRSDVTEEAQRVRSHVSQARELLRADAPAGKSLDFLAQELMREANTIGSKAASAPLVQEVVRFKGEIEKLREQVQNVE